MGTVKTNTVHSQITSNTKPTWKKSDTLWVLGLYGTAVGAGTLFLPINAGVGGLIPLLVMAVLALPMTFFAHRGMTRFVLSSSNPGADITEVVEEHFGTGMGKVITLLYFFAIYPILLVYSVALTNTVESFMQYQLGIEPPARALLAFMLIIGLMAIVRLGEQLIVKAMSVLVFPFVAVLLMLALYLVPYWNGAIFNNVIPAENGVSSILMAVWLILPVMVFSFNHSPVISSFAVATQKEHGAQAEQQCSRILARSHIMMVVTVMFFVFSCVLSLSPANLAEAKAQNVSILTYLANHFDTPIIAYAAPVVAIIAITKSFLGHYLGASEGLKGLMIKMARGRGKTVGDKTLNTVTALFMLVSSWAVATINPSILGMIESLGGPIIAMLLFIMPMYAIQKVPAMRKYSGALSNIFIVVIGLISISAIFYSLAQ
ncbi:HAAAP family serine/threonine permease [Photobacterium ganghwense]|uniref:Serine/threonine protein kinase n=1 Tax=Photobacterium ganghwense TaxID=320778 RepID=A0A0J1HA72_9GAMM|nr:HAAAP family serine/threonine permease [Photobacterium ganghwense]KLV08588.1 serine/threonine protein kinase [Photobacterium ganghwense]MBV1839083.1 HAAAP family serine/threonine permease [Photobacterium ganghwense]PSU10703.1 HAAAP family serine/threonine permease [Photobacterium ganghwense]